MCIRSLGGRSQQDAVAGPTMLTGEIMQIENKTQFENAKRFEQMFNSAQGLDYSFLDENDTDMLVEKLIDNMQSSPLGQLLNVISTLPEVRTEKVELARRQIDQPEECWDTRTSIFLQYCQPRKLKDCKS